MTPRTVACQSPLSMEFSREEYRSGLPCPPPGDLPKPGIEPRSLALQVDFLPTEPPWKPKNTGVGSLSLLQQIFPTQDLKRGRLQCRRILYQLSYQGTTREAPSFGKLPSIIAPFSSIKSIASLNFFPLSLSDLCFHYYIIDSDFNPLSLPKNPCDYVASTRIIQYDYLKFLNHTRSHFTCEHSHRFGALGYGHL